MTGKPTYDLPQLEDFDQDGHNTKTIVCTRCSSIILKPKQGLFLKKDVELPIVNREKQTEIVQRHIYVENIYTFENMGFSNTVNDMKYLVCAECEYGPIGYMSIPDKKSYLTLDRVGSK